MKLSSLRFVILATSSCAAFAFACGGISDPTRVNGTESVATVSGALTGTSVPSNARVALVWNNGAGGQAVGDDVAIVNGKFTMNLGVPAASYFANIDGAKFVDGSGSSSGSTPPMLPTEEPNTDPPPPSSSSSGSSSGGGSGGGSSSGGGMPAFGLKLTPRDSVSGGITSPLSAAIAGFVVYADTNGNGKLDLAGPYAASTDQILGGNRELLLAYLKDGGALDYEKLRDTSGILPTAGFNLAWLEGRWLPLNVVELKLDANAKLPPPVCAFSDAPSVGGGSSGSEPMPLPAPDQDPDGSGSSSGGSSGPLMGYPSPTDPNLSCSPDGRSFTYRVVSDCPAPAPIPVGLCSNAYGTDTMGCAGGAYGGSLPVDGTVPPGWPCPIAVDAGAPATDAGPAPAPPGVDAGAGG